MRTRLPSGTIIGVMAGPAFADVQIAVRFNEDLSLVEGPGSERLDELLAG